MLLRPFVLAALLVAIAGCTPDQTLVPIGPSTVDARRIDDRPLDLLPSGALLVGDLDARALFSSPLGAQMAQIVENLLPLGRESRFSAQRDVHRVVGGVYAMQGADFAAVLQGRFDVPAIQRAAQARSATPSGVPLVQTRYGPYTLYTVADVGFVPLTSRTILSGNETGMRRALDRLRYGQLESSIEPWMSELLRDEQAAFVVAGDVGSQGVVQAAGGRLPFVAGLELVRVLGNFRPPGMNMVGSLTYASEQQAKNGAKGLEQLQQLAYFGSLLSTLGFGGSLPELDARPQGHDVAFATEVDTRLAQMVLELVARATDPGG